jgi:hypothetical protein
MVAAGHYDPPPSSLHNALVVAEPQVNSASLALAQDTTGGVTAGMAELQAWMLRLHIPRPDVLRYTERMAEDGYDDLESMADLPTEVTCYVQHDSCALASFRPFLPPCSASCASCSADFDMLCLAILGGRVVRAVLHEARPCKAITTTHQLGRGW